MIRQVFGDAGCTGTLCVQSADDAHEVALDADAPMVAASVFKVLVALEAEARFADGRLDAREQVVLPAGDRAPGPTGYSLFTDDVTTSLRDLVVAMLTISDNAATDVLLERVGIDACNATARRLGLSDTVIVGDLGSAIDSLAHAAGFSDWAALTEWMGTPHAALETEAVDAAVAAAPALDPARATRTTARDMCVLLRAIWDDSAAPPPACARVRATMARQLTRNRIAAGFPLPAKVAAKSGGFVGIVRNEVGMVELPDGRRFAVAAFTHAATGSDGPAIDAAIGEAARRAVAQLA